MSNKTKFILLVLGVFLAGLLFSFSKPGQVVADMKPLLVEVLNLPLPVTGAVNVENLPLDEKSNSLRTIPAADSLRYGQALLVSGERRVLIPEGVVLTDVLLYRDITSNDDPCPIWVGRFENGSNIYLFHFMPSAVDPLVELHLESGLLSTASSSVMIYLNANNCNVLGGWTGYEY